MKIYDVENFPNPFRVRMALAEKGATDQVQFLPVDVMSGEHRSAEFRQKNVGAAVPVLELDDGTCISESPAIIEFVDHHFDGPSLTGKGAKERAVISMMQRRAETMVTEAVGGYFHHATEGLGPALETNQNEKWGQSQREKAEAGFAYFDDVLANDEYLAGDYFSMADITLFAGLAFADFAKIEIPASLANLHAWRSRIARRPSVTG
jgi:glutathione S-transferase